jgi:hypothetical protein
MSSTTLVRPPSARQLKVGSQFGAPPPDLASYPGPITDFFRAAPFSSVLSEDFLSDYAGTEPEWGPLGYVTYKRTYARPLYPADLWMPTEDENGVAIRDPNVAVRSEDFWETLTRVLNGQWHIIRCHSARKNIDFDEATARRKAEAAFIRMWNFKWLPPGRGLWMTGTRFMYLKGSAATMNCAFVTTKDIDKQYSEPFTWAMDMSMLGVGVGSDTRGAGKLTVKAPKNLINETDLLVQTRRIRTNVPLIPRVVGQSDAAYRERISHKMHWAVPKNSEHVHYKLALDKDLLVDTLHIDKAYHVFDPSKTKETFLIPDSREGWVESVGMVIDAFFRGNALPIFDYSIIRPRGTPIKSFGGVAEGPEPLKLCHENLIAFFLDRIGKQITSSDIVDIFNELGNCVVSGNVRRSAQILLGEPQDQAFISLKHDTVNHPNSWNSNNSILAELGMDYSQIAQHIYDNGEPGLMWMDNVRKYARIGELNARDAGAMGTNPCGEITLFSWEACNLVENFPSRHDSLEDLKLTLKQSYLYAKTITLFPSHSKRTNNIQGKNARIGCSLSGVQNMRAKLGVHEMYRWMDEGYQFIDEIDKIYSDWFQCRRSIKKTAIKPSGTITKLVPEVDEGVHHATANYYLKNMIFSRDNYMVQAYRDAGYDVRPLPEQPDTAVLISLPVHKKHIVRTEYEAAESIFEQLEVIAGVQTYWADNQVSVTIKFHQHTPACRSLSKVVGGRKERQEKCQCRAVISNDIKTALELYEGRLKSVAFLPFFEPDQTAYAWLPEQKITAQEYEAYVAKIRPVVFQAYVDDLDPEACAAGGCPVR